MKAYHSLLLHIFFYIINELLVSKYFLPFSITNYLLVLIMYLEMKESGKYLNILKINEVIKG